MTNNQSNEEQNQRYNEPELRRDFFLLFLVPTVVLTIIYLHPQSEQILEYKARNPTILSILGSNLAHRTNGHIIGNLMGYWLLGGTAYLLLREADSTRIYRYAFVAYLLVLPFFASETILFMFADRPEIVAKYESVGFSLTVGAITGLLAVAIAKYYVEIIDDGFPWIPSLGLFVLGFSLAFYNLNAVSNTTLFFTVIGLAILLYMAYRLRNSFETYANQRIVRLVGAIAVFVFGLLSLFPASAPTGIYAHMAGYVWGYFLPLGGIFVTTVYQVVHARLMSSPS
ncbi:hypothetical protein [Halogeometricum luteum]|uniref:Rhomboid family protein n=1 Tax=Halogeometricum luteum TaxID=2950537 RepID=A0ABU2G787_9EURY|nr:hypothetical protein [Halogeometricum sp. S3BR5-2]MDS0296656.1 hypothetical protein [Halogeometricum sp. S3BR5-2]